MHTKNGKVEAPSIDLYKLCAVMVDMQPPFLEEVIGNESSMLITSHKKLLEICIEKDYPLIALEYQGKGRTTKRLREIIQEVKRHIFIEKDSDDDSFYLLDNFNLFNTINIYHVFKNNFFAYFTY